MLANLLPSALAAAVAPEVGYAQDAESIVTKIEPVQGANPYQVNLQVTTKKDGAVYAVLLQKSDRSKITSIGAITDGTYDKLPALAGNAHYRYGKVTLDAPGTQTISLGAALPTLQVNENSTTYHRSYTFIVFDSATKLENASDYAEGTFRIDSEGKLQRESYMVRYMKNGSSAGGAASTPTAIPANQITDWGKSTTLSSATPQRTGYNFLGWDENKDLLGTDPNTAAGSTVQPTYKASGTYPAPSGAYSAEKDKIVSLYATWKPKQVQFDGDSKTFTGDQTPRVGVAFDSGKLALTGTTASDTDKTYTVTSGGLPAGLKVTQADKTHWQITGTPTTDSAGAPVTAVIQVKDRANNTTDTITVTFSEVKRGLRRPPDTDVNTGLASRIDPAGEGEDAVADGQIIGFYSAGQPAAADEANTGMTDGTGTYTAYYLKQGMVYEYRPKTVGGAAFDNDADASTEVPWREIPAPESYYAELAQADKDALAASMQAGAATVIETTIADGKATLTQQTAEAGWHAAYGSIQFDEGLPVVHGLAADDVYEVRFRKSATFDASTAVDITVGGAAGGDTSGPPSTDDFRTVVFYDWDGTLLGSRIVAVGGSLKGEKLEDCGDGADQAPKPPEGELLYDADGDGEYDFIGNNNVGNDAKNKAGYTFAGWVDYETGYSVPNVPSTERSIAKIPKDQLVSLSKIQENLILKAAYDENDKLSTGANMTTNPNLRRYLISYTPFVKSGTSVTTTITVRRPENARRSVEGEAYLRIALQPIGLGQTVVTVPLGMSDVETFVFSMPVGADATYNAVSAITLSITNYENATISAPTLISASELA